MFKTHTLKVTNPAQTNACMYEAGPETLSHTLVYVPGFSETLPDSALEQLADDIGTQLCELAETADCRIIYLGVPDVVDGTLGKYIELVSALVVEAVQCTVETDQSWYMLAHSLGALSVEPALSMLEPLGLLPSRVVLLNGAGTTNPKGYIWTDEDRNSFLTAFLEKTAHTSPLGIAYSEARGEYIGRHNSVLLEFAELVLLAIGDSAPLRPDFGWPDIDRLIISSSNDRLFPSDSSIMRSVLQALDSYYPDGQALPLTHHILDGGTHTPLCTNPLGSRVMALALS